MRVELSLTYDEGAGKQYELMKMRLDEWLWVDGGAITIGKDKSFYHRHHLSLRISLTVPYQAPKSTPIPIELNKRNRRIGNCRLNSLLIRHYIYLHCTIQWTR